MNDLFKTRQITSYRPHPEVKPDYQELERLRKLKAKQDRRVKHKKIKRQHLTHNLNQARDLRRAWKYLKETDAELKARLLQDL